MFETLKRMKSDKKQVFADIVCFDLPFRKEEGKIKQGKIMSTKVCQMFLYSIHTLVYEVVVSISTWNVKRYILESQLCPDLLRPDKKVAQMILNTLI